MYYTALVETKPEDRPIFEEDWFNQPRQRGKPSHREEELGSITITIIEWVSNGYSLVSGRYCGIAINLNRDMIDRSRTSGLDDGHVHLRRRSELIKDIISFIVHSRGRMQMEWIMWYGYRYSIFRSWSRWIWCRWRWESSCLCIRRQGIDTNLDSGGRGEGMMVQFHTPFSTTPSSLVAGIIAAD